MGKALKVNDTVGNISTNVAGIMAAVVQGFPKSGFEIINLGVGFLVSTVSSIATTAITHYCFSSLRKNCNTFFPQVRSTIETSLDRTKLGEQSMIFDTQKPKLI